jgi:hypothetical protein
MDISKASNFERFVFDLLGRDGDRPGPLPVASTGELVALVRARQTTEPRFLVLAETDLHDPAAAAHDEAAFPGYTVKRNTTGACFKNTSTLLRHQSAMRSFTHVFRRASEATTTTTRVEKEDEEEDMAAAAAPGLAPWAGGAGSAGIWRPTPEGPVFAMLTCEPNPLVAGVHHKAMPVILHDDDHATWLTGATDAALALAQRRNDRLRTQKHAIQVGAHHGLPTRERGFFNRPKVGHACVVHQRVNAPGPALYRAHHGLHLLFVGHIAVHGQHVLQALRGTLQFNGVAVHHGHLVALGQKQVRGGQSNAACGAGDDGGGGRVEVHVGVSCK